LESRQSGAQVGHWTGRRRRHPTQINPPQPSCEGKHLSAYVHPPGERERGRQVHELLPLSSLGEEPPHYKARLRRVEVLTELGDSVPVRWPLPVCGSSEKANAAAARGPIRAVDVR
jgi:hypothetical protein